MVVEPVVTSELPWEPPHYEHEQMNREIPYGRRSRRRARLIAATADLSARQLLSRLFRKNS